MTPTCACRRTPTGKNTDLQRDALLAAGVYPRHLFEEHASGAKDDRTGLARVVCAGVGTGFGERAPINAILKI